MECSSSSHFTFNSYITAVRFNCVVYRCQSKTDLFFSFFLFGCKERIKHIFNVAAIDTYPVIRNTVLNIHYEVNQSKMNYMYFYQ